MLTIKIQVDAPSGCAQGVKEALAMQLERWGKARVVEIVEDKEKQMALNLRE